MEGFINFVAGVAEDVDVETGGAGISGDRDGSSGDGGVVGPGGCDARCGGSG